MDSKGLLFIPDISGFTRFINANEISHSKLIIQELLEVLINANKIGLEISEIEGDAILFYKYGDPPTLVELYGQVEKMFCEFHKSLVAYEQQRYCWCEACTSAINLTLKVITHYGEFTGYNVKQFNKLIGKDVILAHQLLKNEIEPHEYWLVTSGLLQENPESFTGWMKWNSGSKETEDGDVPFQYTYISPLKENISHQTIPAINLSDLSKKFSLIKEYETDIVTLFHAVGDFKYRSQWMEGVQKVQGITHSIPRSGTQCKCITANGEMVIRSNSYSASPERLEVTELYGNTGFLHLYTLEKISGNSTRLTFNFYMPKNIIANLIFTLAKKNKTEASMTRSLQNIDKVAAQIKLLREETIPG
jgi:hypothetical protein